MSLCHATHGVNERLFAGSQGEILSSISGITLCGKGFGSGQFDMPMIGTGDSLEIVAHGEPASVVVTCATCRYLADKAAELIAARKAPPFTWPPANTARPNLPEVGS